MDKRKCKCGAMFTDYKNNGISIHSKCEECRSAKMRTEIKRTPIKKKQRKATGERDMFLEIWNERPHNSQLSGRPLLPIGHRDWIKQFLHVLGKGTYPELRLCKDNILLGLPDEHDNQDKFAIFVDKKEQLKRKVYESGNDNTNRTA